jgi:glutathione reductase (NADPH)
MFARMYESYPVFPCGAGPVSVDWATLKARRDAYVGRLNGIYASNLDKSDVTLIRGEAKFTGPRQVQVEDATYTVR